MSKQVNFKFEIYQQAKLELLASMNIDQIFQTIELSNLNSISRSDGKLLELVPIKLLQRANSPLSKRVGLCRKEYSLVDFPLKLILHIIFIKEHLDISDLLHLT